MNHIAAQPSLVGQYRRFGPTGPVYEIVSMWSPAGSDEQWLKICIVQSGEIVDYKMQDALGDPEEA